MLLSIMNEQVMCIPDVATRFFRLVLYLIDFSPEALVDADPQLIEALCNCLKVTTFSVLVIQAVISIMRDSVDSDDKITSNFHTFMDLRKHINLVSM